MQKHNAMLTPLIITGFEFADGTILTTRELLARGFDLDGTAGDDQMRWRTRSENISKKTVANDETANAWRIAA
jgi:hypothetical protein